jgi:hypothetical protein
MSGEFIAILGVSTEEFIAILGLSVGGLVGVLGPIIAARSARKRQTEQLMAERERLDRTLAADRLKALIEERRKLLDRGALLLIEIDEALSRQTQSTLRGEGASTSDAAAQEWDECLKKLERFRVRLTLWFDEGSDVLTAFTGVLREVSRQRTEVAGRVGANDRLVELLGRDNPADSGDVARLVEARDELVREAAEQAHDARDSYVRAARAYLAGHAPESGA